MPAALLDCVGFVALDATSFQSLAVEAAVARYATWDAMGLWFKTEPKTLRFGEDAYFALMLERLKLVGNLLARNVSGDFCVSESRSRREYLENLGCHDPAFGCWIYEVCLAECGA